MGFTVGAPSKLRHTHAPFSSATFASSVSGYIDVAWAEKLVLKLGALRAGRAGGSAAGVNE